MTAVMLRDGKGFPFDQTSTMTLWVQARVRKCKAMVEVALEKIRLMWRRNHTKFFHVICRTSLLVGMVWALFPLLETKDIDIMVM